MLWLVSSSFLVISAQYFSMRMYHSLFIHFHIDGHCGVPSFFAIRNKAAKTFSLNVCSHFYWVNIFEKNCLVIAPKFFLKWLYPFILMPAMWKIPHASYFYQQQMLLVFCGSVFICIYLIVNLVSILSTCFVPSSFIYSLSEMPKPFTHFKIGQMVHLNCWSGGWWCIYWFHGPMQYLPVSSWEHRTRLGTEFHEQINRKSYGLDKFLYSKIS